MLRYLPNARKDFCQTTVKNRVPFGCGTNFLYKVLEFSSDLLLNDYLSRLRNIHAHEPVKRSVLSSFTGIPSRSHSTSPPAMLAIFSNPFSFKNNIAFLLLIPVESATIKGLSLGSSCKFSANMFCGQKIISSTSNIL